MDSASADAFRFDWTYPLAFGWGLLVLGALIGWGRAVAFWLLPKDEAGSLGWGLAATWGMAAFLTLSGPLIMLSLFSLIFVTAFIAMGLTFGLCHIHLSSPRLIWLGFLSAWPQHWLLQAALIGLCGLISLSYAVAVAFHFYNSCDDFCAYFTFAKMLLDTGTLFDPFNAHMMLALGGQQALLTLIIGFLPWKYAQLFDCGVAGMIVLGLVQGMVRSNCTGPWIARLLLMILALIWPIPRTSTSTGLTGVAIFAGLLCTFDLVSRQRTTRWQGALLIGSMVTAAATLRSNYEATVALFIVSFVLWRLWEGEINRRDSLKETLFILGGIILLLTPWWIVAYRTDGTCLYPIFKGNQPPGYTVLQNTLPLSETVLFIGNFLFSPVFIPLLFPLFFIARGRQRRLMFLCCGAILLIGIAAGWHYTMGPIEDLHRYFVPIALAFGLYCSGIVANQIIASFSPKQDAFQSIRMLVAILLAVTALILQGTYFFYNNSRHDMELIQTALKTPNSFIVGDSVETYDESRKEYTQASAKIPRGESVLIALDYPFELNFRQHSFFNVELAGATSPPPGFPYFQGPEPVKKYLLKQGIRYIAHVPFEKSSFLFSRSKMESNLKSPLVIYRYWGTYLADFMDNIDALSCSNPVVYESPTIQVIYLSDRNALP